MQDAVISLLSHVFGHWRVTPRLLERGFSSEHLLVKLERRLTLSVKVEIRMYLVLALQFCTAGKNHFFTAVWISID